MVVPGGYGTARHLAATGNVSGDLLLLVENPAGECPFRLDPGTDLHDPPFHSRFDENRG